MKIRPINDWILVRPVALDDIGEDGFRKSAGGIVLLPPEKPNTEIYTVDRDSGLGDLEAVILALGPGKVDKKGRNTGMWGLQVGDRIMHSPNGAQSFEFEGQWLRMLRRDSVVGFADDWTDERRQDVQEAT